MWQLFLKGGVIMWPLALLSVLGVAVFIEKLLVLRTGRVMRREVIDVIDSLRNPDDIPLAIEICAKQNTPLANIIRSGLQDASLPIGEVRQTMEDVGRGEVKRLERYLVVIETVAAASPLLGLLGTVLGMIKVFSVISIAGVGEAGLLSGGIAEALITTAFGLAIGIPALVAYNFFDSRVENFVIKIEGYMHVLLKRLGGMNLPRSVDGAKSRKIRDISDGTQEKA